MPEPTPEIDAVVKALARLSLTKPDGRSCPLPLALAVGIEDHREDQRYVFEAIELIAQTALRATGRHILEDPCDPPPPDPRPR